MDMNFRDLIDDVIRIAQIAGDKILDIYKKADDFEVEKKADNSPVSIADKASNSIICSELERLPLKFPILSEENAIIPFSERSKYDYFWLVDPLDGTKEFIKKNDEFTVNIALIHAGKTVMGVIQVPVTGEIFFATDGDGAFERKDGEDIRLAANVFSAYDEKLRFGVSRSHLQEDTKQYISSFENPVVVSVGSSLKFVEIAKGNMEIYPRFGPCMEWDTAAGHCILVEAGGQVVSVETQKALLYNKKNLVNPFFIAFGKTDQTDIFYD